MRRPFIAIVLLAFGLGVFWLTRAYYRPNDPTTEVQADVLLQQVRKVLKVVAVEGEFSELYDHSDSWKWGTSIPGVTEKKIILRVKARVSVGYDLGNINIEADEGSRTLYIGPLPQPTILSIDHDVDYYDISEGAFNHFSEAELNKINRDAKARIEEQVPASGLYQAAEEQRKELLEMIATIAGQAGWQLAEGGRPVDGRSRL